MRSSLGLSALPGELQEQIILNLHPSAAVALRQTNHHFQTIISLRRYNIDDVRAFLRDRARQPRNARYLPCYSCLWLKLRSNFIMGPCNLPRGQVSFYDPHRHIWTHGESCFECAVATGRFLPGNVSTLPNETDKVLFCIACLTLQNHFCEKCRWCTKCASSGTVNTYRKEEMGYRVVPILNRCWGHEWHHNYTSKPVTPVTSDRLLRLQTQAVKEFQLTSGGPAIVGWYDSAEEARLEHPQPSKASTKRWGLKKAHRMAHPSAKAYHEVPLWTDIDSRTVYPSQGWRPDAWH